MALHSIGDLAQGFVLRKQGAELTRQMDRLTAEVSTGRAADIPKAVSGNLLPLADIERALSMAGVQRDTTRIAALDAGIMQTALSRVGDGADTLANSALMTTSGQGAADLGGLAQQAQGTLSDMVGSLNSTSAGRALFGGDASDRAPLAGADILRDALRAELAAAPDAASVKAALDTFFDSPGGGFATSIYRGGTAETSPYALGAGEAVTLRIRGDDAALRDQLKQTAMLSLVDDPALGLTEADRVALAQEAGMALRTGQEGVVRLQAQLGFAEERIAQAESRIETEITSLGIARNDLLSVDVAESATALEQVQSQLELLYTITARSSRLNLANFLS
jgi:flagellar hook-associated protein 3 FlgL